jgi:hypothetical protein
MAAPEILAGAGAAVLVGHWALPRGRGVGPASLAEDFAVGLAIVVPAAFVWGLAGLPWTPLSMPALGLAAAAALRLAFGRRDRASAGMPAAPVRPADRAAEALLAIVLVAAAWKWMGTPLWSWDHFAMWGLKARRLIDSGSLDLGFLNLTQYVAANPDYPIGLPLATRYLSPSLPSPADFRLVHGLFAAALAAGVHGAARRLGSSRAVAAVVTALLVASPLFWDTEAVGLGDLPLACAAVAAILLALEARSDARFPAWPAGLVIGFLPWIKVEGAVLAVFLAAACLALVRRNGAFLLPGFALAAGALATRVLLLPPGIGFLEGDWTGRVADRARAAGPMVSAMLADLGGREWFGLWFLFAVAVLFAFRPRATAARALAAVVLAQIAVYAVVYLGTFMDPLGHVDASFHRLAGALAPLALLAVTAAALPAVRDRNAPA